MKNRSWFWPLAFIAAGSLWILVNMGIVPASNLWALAQIWPFMLIALGLGLILRAYWAPGGMLVSFLIVLFAVLAVLFAPQLGWDRIPAWSWQMDFGNNVGGGVAGSGKIVMETREANDFHAVSIDYPAEVTIQQGSSESVSIQADDNLLPQLSTQVRNGTLHIENSEPEWRKRISPTQAVRISITVKELSEVDFSTAGSMKIEKIKTSDLRLLVSGAGDVALVQLNVHNLEVRLSGAGSIKTDGVADSLNLRISGMGSFEGAELSCQTADVQISGAGNATLWLKDELTAEISGAGSIDYYGNPDVRQQISGVGSVKSLGNK